MFYMECRYSDWDYHRLTNHGWEKKRYKIVYKKKTNNNMLFYVFATDIRRRQTGQMRVTNNQLATHSEWNKWPHSSFFSCSFASKFVRHIALRERERNYIQRSSHRIQESTNRFDWIDQVLCQIKQLVSHQYFLV